MNIRLNRITLVLFILLMVISTACSPSGSASTAQPATGVKEADTATAAPTPTPTVPPTPAVDQEVLKSKWRTPIGAYALTAGVCKSAQDTVAKAKNGSDTNQLSGEILGIRLILGMVNGAMEQWSPDASVAAYKTNVVNHIASITQLFEQWSGGSKTTTDMDTELTKTCAAIQKEVEDMVVTANKEGLTQETLTEIGKEMQESMQGSQTAQAEPTAVPTVPAGPGMSRQNPYPVGSAVTTENWQVQVTEVKRGDEAWQMIQQANQFNDPAPDGMEYLLVKIKAKNISKKTDEQQISKNDFRLTGSKNIEYSSLSVVAPEPVLEAKLFLNGENEGWVPLIAAKDENNLILIAKEMFSFDDASSRFVALEDGATISIPAELNKIQPNDLGIDRATPATKGQTVITNDWEITVGDVVRGDEAWNQIKAANQFNDPPADGMEYVLVKVKAHYIGQSNTSVSIQDGDFKSSGSANVMYDKPSVIPPNPLEARLFSGGEAEGWVPMMVKKDESSLQLVFSPMFEFSDVNRRFMALE